MSEKKNDSWLLSALRGAVVLCGIAVLVSIAARLLLEVWWIIAIVLAVGFGLWLLVRFIRRNDL
ncbi:hypothetical protein C5C00_01675 [Rathayibacter rathayi]|uniref:hypothetical protein n=1 Tax=Rathayibacter rathayi TaxID=33887 RepID=UPI000CE7E5DC|nr:hypothetical protein [Rathayibacter rathayi]PPG90711.1 hypothetical protein C5C47_00950 [Rathayibacter rathayi]PPG98757.1 hypothetical protein C5C00_01675 [Rathayibacter rathayi]